MFTEFTASNHTQAHLQIENVKIRLKNQVLNYINIAMVWILYNTIIVSQIKIQILEYLLEQ